MTAENQRPALRHAFYHGRVNVQDSGFPRASLRHRCQVALAAGLFVAAWFSHAADPKASRLYEDALQRFESKDHAGAIVQLKNALQIDKNLLPVHVLLGKALLAQSQPIPAEAAFLEALRLGVSREEVVVPLARASLDIGKARAVLDDERFAEAGLSIGRRFDLLVLKAGAADDVGDGKLALQLLEKARDINATSPDTWLAEAKLRLRLAQFREAQAAADKALSLAPGQADALYGRGNVSHAQGDLKAALGFYDKALQGKPDHVDALVSRAGLLMDLNRQADATKDVQSLLKAAPNDARGFYLSALLAKREGREPDARQALARVTALIDPIPIEMLRYRPQLLMLGGLAHYDLDETEKAMPFLEGVLQQQPGSPVAKLMARIHMKQDNFERAIEALEGYRRQHPRDDQASLLLASAHMAQGRHVRAIQLLQTALQAGPKPELQHALGMAHLKAGQFDKALVVLEAAYKESPRFVPAGTALAALYLQLGQAGKAVRVAEQLAKGQADQPGLMYLLGKAKLQAGDRKGARAALEAAAKLDARFLDPQVELAKLDLLAGDNTAAGARLAAAIERNPKHVELLSLLGQLMISQGRLDEGQKWLEKADDHSAKDVVDHGMRLVDYHLAQGQVDRAREAMKRVTLKIPDAPRVLLMQSRIELAAGDRRVAQSTLSRASTNASQDPRMLVLIAESQLAAGDAAGATHSATKALALSPQDIGAQIVLTRTDALQGNSHGAEKRARELTVRLPKSGIGHTLLGEIAAAQQQNAAATQAFRRAHELEGNQGTLLQLFAHLARTRAPDAMVVAEQWLKKHPQDPAVQRALADAQARAGNWPGARKAYEALLKLRPDDAEALNNLAQVHLAQNDAAAALKSAERAAALKPGAAHIMGTLGWAAHKAGQNDRALQSLRDARLRNPDSPETRYYLGATLAALGRSGEAKAELTAAVQSNRPFPGQKDAQALLKTLN
jgi:cellulose synthase operon protein C